ncbi:hypothetical protein [Hydrocarboniphaga effusa]|jgi:hypothetical protein|uniref:hypothetical protein n=1 Tax=Hydrocarboniphaga effusa TaxID=243629 RepID=UPI003137D5AA
MPKSIRAFLLILVVLVEGLSSALAMAPMKAMSEQTVVETMPCHDQASVPAKMPCCDDQKSDCHCNPNCFGALTALAPLLSAIDGFVPSRFEKSPAAVALPPVRPDRLLRPPAVLLS